MNRISSAFYIILITAISGFAYWHYVPEQSTLPTQPTVESIPQDTRPFTRANTLSGSYLAGRFAQRQYDWSAASGFIGQILAQHPDDPALLKRQMVLAMGSGDHEQALALARRLDIIEKNGGGLTALFLSIADFKAKNYTGAQKHIQAMTSGGLSDFILPLLRSWADAGVGINNTQGLTGNTIHLYHSILINTFMKNPQQVESHLNKALAVPDLGSEDLERMGDLFAQIDKLEKAGSLYKEALALNPDNAALLDKIEKLEKNEKLDIFSEIQSAEQGVAEALFDMARLLAQEYNDESALVFAQMAAYLNPEMAKTRFLLAALSARNNHYKEAIEAYHSIPPEDKNYLEARRAAVSLMEEHGYIQEALKELEQLVTDHKDIEAMIQIGDLYRGQDDFKNSIKAYDHAEQALGGKISADYWHLLYVRGMAHEQAGDWPSAERDLKAALKYQPSHPYILNYLGYAWADQGVHLDQALSLIEKAVSVRPDDGYITDSLGWVFYKMNRFKEAVPYLEQAVELMPYDSTVNDHLGDAYWQVGRRLEARFQWERAKNHTKDESLIKTLEDKIVNGLPDKEAAEQNKNYFALDKHAEKPEKSTASP